MTYYQLQLIKKSIEVQPSDTTLDQLLRDFGVEGDAWVDSELGLTAPLNPVEPIVQQAASNYAAGRYYHRLKDFERGDNLIKVAGEQLQSFKQNFRRVTVFG